MDIALNSCLRDSPYYPASAGLLHRTAKGQFNSLCPCAKDKIAFSIRMRGVEPDEVSDPHQLDQRK